MLDHLRRQLGQLDFETLKLTAQINAISFFKLPLLAFITPRVVRLDEQTAIIRVRLDHRSRNHLGTMYFGALSMGAELSILTKALQAIQRSGRRIDFVFKDFSAQFLKRADGHVHFICEDGAQVEELIQKAAQSGAREEGLFKGYAIVPSKGDTKVMTYALTLSVKARG